MASESSTPGLLGWLIREARNEEEDEPWDQGSSYTLIPTTSSHKTVQSLDIQSTSGKISILAVMLDDGNPSYPPLTILTEFLAGSSSQTLRYPICTFASTPFAMNLQSNHLSMLKIVP